MSDYARILSKINETNWLITQGGLDTILQIVEDRLILGKLSDEDIMLRLEDSSTNDKRPRQIFRSVNGVAVIPVMGPVFGKGNMLTMMSGATSLQMIQQQLRAAMADTEISSIIMEYDTPGGSSDLVEEFGQEIAMASSQKPIYSSVNTMCGSAGLWLATQGNKVYITPSGTMGSLGVYTAHTDRSGADLKSGIKHTYVSAGRYKTEGNPHEPLSASAIAHRQDTVNALMEKFVGAVASGRNLDTEHVRNNFGEGRMFDAQPAVDVGMADGVMSFDHLLASLTQQDKPKAVTVSMPDGVFANAFLDNNNVLTWADTSTNQFDVDRDLSLLTGGVVHQSYDNNGKEDTDMRLSAEALTALGLPEDATEEQIGDAIVSMNAQLLPLRDLRNTIDASKKFAEMFPEEHKRMQELESHNRRLEASTFSKAYRDMRFADVKIETQEDGSKTKTIVGQTTKGLSGLALQEIEDVFLKSTTSEGIQLSDVKSMLDSVMTGMVDYGTKGTEVGAPIADDSPFKPSGNIQQVRQQFADKVVEVMTNDSLDEDAAIKVVAERHPDLFAAYKNSAAFINQ